MYFEYNNVAMALLQNKSSEYVEYYKYFKFIEDKSLLRTVFYLHNELIISVCNRASGDVIDISLRHLKLNLGIVSDFKEWLLKDDYMFPKMAHVLEIYDVKELHSAFHVLHKAKMVMPSNLYVSSIVVQYPVLGKVLPVVRAYMKLLHRFKIQKSLESDLIESIKNTPVMLKKKYSKFTKKELIEFIINKQIKEYDLKNINKRSPLFSLIVQELVKYRLPEAMLTYLRPYLKDQKSFIQNEFQNFFDEIKDEIMDEELSDVFKEPVLIKQEIKRIDNEVDEEVSANDLLKNIEIIKNKNKNKSKKDKKVSIEDLLELPDRVMTNKEKVFL